MLNFACGVVYFNTTFALEFFFTPFSCNRALVSFCLVGWLLT